MRLAVDLICEDFATILGCSSCMYRDCCWLEKGVCQAIVTDFSMSKSPISYLSQQHAAPHFGCKGVRNPKLRKAIKLTAKYVQQLGE